VFGHPLKKKHIYIHLDTVRGGSLLLNKDKKVAFIATFFCIEHSIPIYQFRGGKR